MPNPVKQGIGRVRLLVRVRDGHGILAKAGSKGFARRVAHSNPVRQQLTAQKANKIDVVQAWNREEEEHEISIWKAIGLDVRKDTVTVSLDVRMQKS